MTNYLLFLTMPLIVWVLIVLITKRPVHSSDKMRRNYLFVAGFCLFLMVALRHYSVGSGDGGWYYNNWNYMASGVSLNELGNILAYYDVESGYLFCTWLLAQVFKAPQYVFVFYGLLMSIAVCRFLYKYCSDVVMGLVMFSCLGLWGFMMQGLRQGIAMCICLFAVDYCLQRKFIPFLLVVLLAMLFHASSIVFIVVYFFPLFKMNMKSYVIVSISAIMAVVLADRIFSVVNYIMNDTYEVGSVEDTGGGIVTVLIYLLILICSVFVFKENKIQDNKWIVFFFYMTLCGCVTFCMRYTTNTIVQRVALYFSFGQLTLLPMVVQRMFTKRSQFLAHIIVICLCLGIAIYKSSYTTLVPYLFFWQS